jgi:hypothetical protein
MDLRTSGLGLCSLLHVCLKLASHRPEQLITPFEVVADKGVNYERLIGALFTPMT